jgi:hypothetical protein
MCCRASGTACFRSQYPPQASPSLAKDNAFSCSGFGFRSHEILRRYVSIAIETGERSYGTEDDPATLLSAARHEPDSMRQHATALMHPKLRQQ